MPAAYIRWHPINKIRGHIVFFKLPTCVAREQTAYSGSRLPARPVREGRIMGFQGLAEKTTGKGRRPGWITLQPGIQKLDNLLTAAGVGVTGYKGPHHRLTVNIIAAEHFIRTLAGDHHLITGIA